MDQANVLISIQSVMIWFKLFYFFRINSHTSYLIRMIVQVVYDMRFFMMVLIVIFLGFGMAFLMMSRIGGDSPFIPNNDFIDALIYSYLITLGEFQYGEYGSSEGGRLRLIQLFFVGNSFFGLIVMLNLLIAIISQTFEEVSLNKDNARYNNMAKMIDERLPLLPKREIFRSRNSGSYLIFVENKKHIHRLAEESHR